MTGLDDALKTKIIAHWRTDNIARPTIHLTWEGVKKGYNQLYILTEKKPGNDFLAGLDLGFYQHEEFFEIVILEKTEASLTLARAELYYVLKQHTANTIYQIDGVIPMEHQQLYVKQNFRGRRRVWEDHSS